MSDPGIDKLLTSVVALDSINENEMLRLVASLERASEHPLAMAVVGFVLLARPDPSVVRAAAMGTVGLIAVAVGGRGGLRALTTAIVVLLFLDPWLARSPPGWSGPPP